MSDRVTCSMCGDAAIHADSAALCCWCWVVERSRDPHPGHAACGVAAKRIEAIQHRFRSAVLAEREGCALVLEEAQRRVPIAAMPEALKAQARRNPEHVFRGILDTLLPNLAALIRARLDPVPSAKGSGS